MKRGDNQCPHCGAFVAVIHPWDFDDDGTYHDESWLCSSCGERGPIAAATGLPVCRTCERAWGPSCTR